MKNTVVVSHEAGKARVFFIFCFTDPPDPIVLKIEKNKRFFSILFLYFTPTHASTVLEFNFGFSVLSFVLQPG